MSSEPHQGGQPGNTNAVTHGLDLDSAIHRQDGRSTTQRALKQAQSELCRAIGGTPSTQELIMINRAVFVLYRIIVLEGLLANDRSFQSYDELYLRYSRELRESLKALGLSERQPEIMDLRAYIASVDQADETIAESGVTA